MSDQRDVQQVYSVNCDSCSKIIEVINPCLDMKPKKVFPTGFGLSIGGKVVKLKCPYCRHEVWVKFVYS